MICLEKSQKSKYRKPRLPTEVSKIKNKRIFKCVRKRTSNFVYEYLDKVGPLSTPKRLERENLFSMGTIGLDTKALRRKLDVDAPLAKPLCVVSS